MVEAINQFGFQSYQVLARENKSQNVVFSPLGLGLLVAYLYGQSSVGQKAELAQIMGWQNFSELEIMNYLQSIREKVQLQDHTLLKMQSVHLLCNRAVELPPQTAFFRELGMGFSLFPTGGNVNDCQNSLNTIMKETAPFKTVEIPLLQNDIFAQAFHFQMKWEPSFLSKYSHPLKHAFLIKSGLWITHPTVGMTGSHDWLVSADNTMTGAAIDSAHAFYRNTFLRASLGEWEKNPAFLDEKLGYSYWKQLQKSFEKRSLKYIFPRFKTQYEFAPLDLLKKINPQLNVSQSFQLIVKTALDQSQNVPESDPDLESRSEYTINENSAYFPFTLIITDKETGLILLIAAIRNPAQDPL